MRTQGKWEVGYKDQGMGHGTYGVITEHKEVLIENLELEEAQSICKAVNNHERLVTFIKGMAKGFEIRGETNSVETINKFLKEIGEE